MSPTVKLIRSDENLPESVHVVIIGAGIVGASAAFYLARRGITVALIEKGNVGGEQSSRNWGWCRQQNRDARELSLATKSLELWDRFSAEGGEDTGFQRCGLFYLSDSQQQLAIWAKWGEYARSVGVTTHMLSSAEASRRGEFTGK